MSHWQFMKEIFSRQRTCTFSPDSDDQVQWCKVGKTLFCVDTQTALNFQILSTPQTLPEICSEQDEMDFLMEALIMRCDGGGSHLVYITLVHTHPTGSAHILRQQRHLFCVRPLGGARCLTVIIKKQKRILLVLYLVLVTPLSACCS